MAQSIHIEIGGKISSKSGVLYRTIQKLGYGGNSEVYLVQALRGPNIGVLFAFKIFTRLAKPERLERFSLEADFLRECNHPSIMRIYDDGIYPVPSEAETKEYPFVIVEYLPNTLYDMMRKGTSSAERVSYTLQLLSGLIHLDSHSPQVVHRDIKPKNIFVKGKSCVLGDFGLMKFLNADEDVDREIYKESLSIGMPFFHRTPDLVDYLKSKKTLTTKTDVFQLGLVLAEMFTGYNPQRKAKELLDPVVVDPLKDIPGAMAIGIKNLIEKMLEQDISKRPKAIELIDSWDGIFREIVTQSHQLDGRVF